MKKILNFLRPLNNVIWKHLVQSKLILFCGGGDTTIIEAPDPVDVSGSMTDYLAAITDPEMLQKQLTAEGQYGPQFDAISLARTQTMLEGIEGGKDSEAYRLQELKLEGLRKAKEAAGAGVTVNIDDQVFAQLGPVPPKEIGKFGVKNNPVRDNPEYKTYKKREEILRRSLSTSATADIDVEIAAAEAALNVIGEGKGQPGLLDMAENASLRAAEIQRQANDALRRGDIESLKELGLETTEALRAADPSSAEIADLTSQIAKASSKRAIEGIEPSAERQRLGELGQSQIDRIGELEQLLPSERSEAEKAELDNLRSIRSQQEQRAQRAQALADDPSLDPSRAGLSTLRDQALAVAQAAPQLGAGQETGSLQELAQMGMQQARAASARAGDPQVALQGLGESRDTVRASMLGGLPESIMMREQMFESDAFADQLRTQALEGTLSPERQRLQEQARALSAQAGEMSTAAGMVTPQQQGLRNRAQDLATRADEMFAQSGRVTPEQEELRRQSQALFSQADELAATAGDVTPEQQAIRDQASQIQARAQQLFAQAEAAPSAEKLRLQQEARNLQARSDQLFTQADTEAAALRERAGQVTPQQQEALNRAQSLNARADQMFAQAGQVTPEIQNLRDQASQLFESAGQVTPEQEQLRGQASAMQQRAQGLFAQAQVAPSAQKQQLQAAAMDMMRRGQGLFQQAATPSSARQAAGELAQLSAEQARQLSADAMGPLSAQRRRMAEQAARQQGLRTGRIGDQAQLAAELLNREESRAALREEARRAQDLAFQQASGFATDIETDAARLREQALGFETGGFDRARGVEGDIDAQRLALLEQGRLAEAQALASARGIESDIASQRLAQQQLGLQTGLSIEDQLASQKLAEQGQAADLALGALGAQRGVAGDIASREAALLQEARLTGQGLRSDALTAQAQAAAQARGVEGDIDAQRLALIQEGRLAEAAALEGAMGIEGQISQQQLAQRGLALDARRAGLSAGTTLEGQIADQEMARQAAANQLALSTAQEARGIEQMLSDQQLARTGQALDARQLAMQEGRALERDVDTLTGERQQAALQAQQAAFGQTSEMRQAREASAMRLNELERARLAEERALAETARLERQAAEAQQQGLLDRARQFRDEAAQRRIEASAFAQQTMEADAAMREEAGRELGAQAQLTGSLLGEEQAFRRQQAEEAAQLRSDVQAAQDTAFTRQAQLAQFDESQRQNALTEALTGTGAAFGQQRQLGGDPANVILGRSSSAPVQGQSMLGQAPAVSQAYQPLFDPSMGVNLAMQQQQNVLSANIAQAQADATRSAAKSGMFGDIVGAAICWVAREVYGIENPRWLAFRHWLLTESPSWFRNLYIKYGERFAKFISNKPFIKNVIRKWMDTKIS